MLSCFRFFWNLKAFFQMGCHAAQCSCCSSWWLWKLIPSEMPSPPHSGTQNSQPYHMFLHPCPPSSLLLCLHDNINMALDLDFSQMSRLQSKCVRSPGEDFPLSICVPIANDVSGFLSDRVIKGGDKSRETEKSPKWFVIIQSWKWMGKSDKIKFSIWTTHYIENDKFSK